MREQNGHHFAEDIYKFIFMNENVFNMISFQGDFLS